MSQWPWVGGISFARGLDWCAWHSCVAAGLAYWALEGKPFALCRAHHDALVMQNLRKPYLSFGVRFLPDRELAEVAMVMQR